MLRLEGLHKRYGDVVALDGAELTANRGRILGFLGPNGAGKTTAMRSVFNLVALDAGTITWDGEPVTRSAQQRFGYMPERRGLYPRMRVRRQVSWLGQVRGMDKAAADASADAWLDRLGLSGRAGDRVEQLSHGNQQRAQLAASLVHEPELLILDEPFSGLDPMGVDAMSALVRERASAGAAVVLSSHQLDLVEGFCDDVAIIDHGHMVVEGSVAEVRGRAPHRRLEVAFTDDAVDWAPDGAHPAPNSRPGVRGFLVPGDADPQGLLASAKAAGDLTVFTFDAPRLSDVFREAVKQ